MEAKIKDSIKVNQIKEFVFAFFLTNYTNKFYCYTVQVFSQLHSDNILEFFANLFVNHIFLYFDIQHTQSTQDMENK